MTLLLWALAVLLLGALAVLILSECFGTVRREAGQGAPEARAPQDFSWVGAGAVVVAAVLGCTASLRVLLGGVAVEQLRLPWPVPFGEFFIELDPLSAWFLFPTLLLSALCAIYGTAYLRGWPKRRALGRHWFFYCLLVLGMTLVLLARNGVLFLLAWELMALASFFLVTFEHERDSVRAAGWVYFVVTHLGTAFLLVFFLLLARETGSMNFNDWAEYSAGAHELAGLLFVLAVIGFGTKAGFMPLHVWLPEAHPAAPSHVSALMSGVMIKTGIYGLFRALTFLGPPPLWWGWTLVGVGLGSGVFGVLFALAQHDLKRLLAYHSVENIGIIALGLGIGLIGVSTGSAALMVLGLGGSLLHVVNHALFKGLLFLGAGSVLHGTHKREMDHLGGLLKRMPWTGATFLVGAVAISGLPPLNGFVSELLIFAGAFKGVTAGNATVAMSGLAVIAGLALIGGLAAACFTKAFGIVFLGEPRSEGAAQAHESGWAMRGTMVFLAACCAGIGLGAPALAPALISVLAGWMQVPTPFIADIFAPVTQMLKLSVFAVLGLVLLTVLLAAVRRALLAGRSVTAGVTWDCGYARPTARMQYTASSFAQPFTRLFRALLQTHEKIEPPQGFLPGSASLHTRTPDPCRGYLYRPAFRHLNQRLSQLRWLQHGNIQLYVLYIALTLLALLVWKLR